MNIQTELQNAGLLYDRSVGYPITLPYNRDKITIAPNDTVTAGLMNLKFKHLYDNFLYLYKSCKISSNIIPISSSGTAGVSAYGTQATWYRNLSTSQFDPFATVGLAKLDQINLLIGINNTEENRYSLIASTGTDIITINSDKTETTFTTVLCAETYDTETETGVYFQNISDLAFGPDNSLLVLDTGAHNLYKYNATGYINSDTVLKDRLFFQKVIGGYGTIYDKLEFNTPTSVCAHDKSIFVLDTGNTCVKRYNEILNWTHTYGLQRDLLSAYPMKIRADANGNIYILTDDLSILRYSNDFTDKSIISLSSIVMDSETFTDIVFSKSDNNIFYVVSDKNIYKKFVNLPQETVGRYLLYLHKFNQTANIHGFASLATEGGDRNILYTTQGTPTAHGLFTAFFDNINSYDVLTIPDFDVYNYDDIKMENEEYVQSWVFNKSISKLITNHMRLRDQIIGKFLFSRDNRSNLVFKFTRYLTVKERANNFFQTTINNFIGKDEVFQNAVVNRCLDEIYNIQANLLNTLKDEVIYAPLSGAVITLN